MELIERMNMNRDNLEEDKIWLTKEVKDYFEDVSKAVLDRYGSDFRILVKILFNNNSTIAYTDCNKVVINAGCEQVQKNVGMENKFLYMKGLLAHELSHILYLDRSLQETYKKAMLNGSLFPRMPKTDNEDAIRATLSDKKKASKLCKIAHNIINIIEDGYGENTYIANYYGSLVEGMKYMRKEFYNDLQTVEELEFTFSQENEKYSAVMNIMLEYALYNKTKGGDDSYEIIQVLNRVKHLIDRSFHEDFRGRLNTTNEIMCELWEYIEPLLENESQNSNDEDDKSQDQSKGNNNQNANGNGSDDSEEPSEYEIMTGKPDTGKGVNTPIAGKDVEQSNREFDENEPVNVNNNFNEEIQDLMEEVLREISENEQEEADTKQLNKEANNGSYVGCEIFINRNTEITDEMIQKYESYSELLEVSKKMQKSVKQNLEDRRKGGKKTNLYLGRKVEVRNVIKNDGRVFYNNALPQLIPRICVCMVIDESGSMEMSTSNGETRIENAKKTAIVVEDFCRSLEFPVCIIGSTADYEEDDGNSELTLYSSFNSVDKKDKYRLTEISAKACNRDGAALNYAYETLLKRPEEIKILFMISDGTPNAYNYGGEIATDELKRISENCKKKGIVLFAAAVGDDKAQIEYIYGDNFLDISDMDAMPKIFTDKIKKFIKR